MHEPCLKPLFSLRSSARRYKYAVTSFVVAMYQPQPLHAHHSTHPRASRWLAFALAAASIILACAWPISGHAGPSDHEQARLALQQGKVLPLRTVIDQVEQQYQGQVIKVEFEREDGIFIYEIRLLQADGKVAKLEIDARDGRLIKMKRKD